MIFHDVEQNSDAWHELRLGKVTASNFGKIMANATGPFGEPAKRYALQLALERATGRKASHSFKNDDMERGNEQEPVARMLYEEMFFVSVKNGGFFDCDEYGDSPDGLIGDDGVIEIKSVIATTHDDTLRRGGFDPAYRWQLVGHLDCTGRQWVDFTSYCEDFPDELQLLTYRVTRDEVSRQIEQLRERRELFIRSLLEPTYQRLMNGRIAA